MIFQLIAINYLTNGFLSVRIKVINIELKKAFQGNLWQQRFSLQYIIYLNAVLQTEQIPCYRKCNMISKVFVIANAGHQKVTSSRIVTDEL